MAPSAHLFIASALLILSHSLLAASGLDVLDTSGNPVQAGAAYILQARESHNAGGVTLVGVDPNNPGTCPKKMGLCTGPPIPVRLYPENAAHEILEVGGRVRAQFGALFHCIPTTWWAIDRSSTPPHGLVHLVPGRQDGALDWFFLGFDGNANAYSLGYCLGGLCREVSVAVRGFDRFLVVGAGPDKEKFRFVFQRYDEMGTAVTGQLMRTETAA